jgi:hypothetical protein
MTKQLKKWGQTVAEFGGSPSQWLRYYAFIYEYTKFSGKAVVDIGGGVGRASYYSERNWVLVVLSSSSTSRFKILFFRKNSTLCFFTIQSITLTRRPAPAWNMMKTPGESIRASSSRWLT